MANCSQCGCTSWSFTFHRLHKPQIVVHDSGFAPCKRTPAVCLHFTTLPLNPAQSARCVQQQIRGSLPQRPSEALSYVFTEALFPSHLVSIGLRNGEGNDVITATRAPGRDGHFPGGATAPRVGKARNGWQIPDRQTRGEGAGSAAGQRQHKWLLVSSKECSS